MNVTPCRNPGMLYRSVKLVLTLFPLVGLVILGAKQDDIGIPERNSE